MNGQYVRNAPQLTGEQAGQIGVPGMAVNNIGIKRIFSHRQRTSDSINCPGKAWIGILACFFPTWIAAYLQVWRFNLLIAEAAYFNRYNPGQGLAQVFDMNTGTTVNVWRVFVGKKSYTA
jgi:hypothetical protein